MPRPPVTQYELESPTATLVLTSLSRYMDDDEAAEFFRDACARSGVNDVDALTPDELLQIVAHLEQMGDLAATCAKGLRVRIKSYIVLAAAQLNR